jgi:uncharacterized protein (DUF433 family)
MKQTLNTNTAVEILMCDHYADWTRAEAEAIIDYFEELEQELDEEIELDPVAIRCEFRAMTIDQVIADYDGCPEENVEDILEWLCERTIVLHPHQWDTIIIQEF